MRAGAAAKKGRFLVGLLTMPDGSKLSVSEQDTAMQTGETVTRNGYKVSWSQSLGWVVQLPLAFPETRGRTVSR